MTDTIVDWTIAARIKGKGKPLTHSVEGSAGEATDAMRAWLWSVKDEIEGDTAKIDLEATLTSAQIPDARHRMSSTIEGLPVEDSIYYQCDWLGQVAAVANWGGGGP